MVAKLFQQKWTNCLKKAACSNRFTVKRAHVIVYLLKKLMSSLTCLRHAEEPNEQINSPTLEGFCMMTQGSDVGIENSWCRGTSLKTCLARCQCLGTTFSRTQENLVSCLGTILIRVETSTR